MSETRTKNERDAFVFRTIAGGLRIDKNCGFPLCNGVRDEFSKGRRRSAMESVKIAASLALAYALGSLPFGFLIAKAFAGADVRRSGSGGTGATNVTRTAGLTAGLLTYACDVAKGALAVWLAGRFGDASIHVMAAAGVIVIVGHMYSIFLKFHGGKGVATGVGVFFVLSPWAALTALGVWSVIFFTTRIVSLGSLAAALALPGFIWFYEGFLPGASGGAWAAKAAWAAVIAVVIVAKHSDNIRRLASGSEYAFKGKNG
jgi:glycerol-3-phosphate acyltransferase PlsY